MGTIWLNQDKKWIYTDEDGVDHKVFEDISLEIERMRKALKKIAKWEGEFPRTGCYWNSGEEMGFSAAFRSNGERDYMREVARKALEGE